VITHDDLVDIIDDEATEDIYRLANVSDADLTINSPVTTQIKRRLPWLYLNTLTALFAAWVISHFKALYAQMALLAVFQSVVTGMGGNAAQQSLAMIVRAIALHDISPHNIPHTLINQAITGLLQGVAVGIFVGLGVYLWAHDILLALILCIALIGNMFVAVIIGTLIPLALKVLKLDPALASTVLITAITDSFGFFLFLGLASIFLH
jgi:magnesium transporter